MNIKNKKLKKLRVIFDNLALSHLNDKNFIFTRKGGKLYSLDKNENHTSQKYEWATYMGGSYFVKLPKSDKIIVCNHVEVNMCFYMRNCMTLKTVFINMLLQSQMTSKSRICVLDIMMVLMKRLSGLKKILNTQ